MFPFLENVIFSIIHLPQQKFPCFDSTANIQEANLVFLFITKFIKRQRAHDFQQAVQLSSHAFE